MSRCCEFRQTAAASMLLRNGARMFGVVTSRRACDKNRRYSSLEIQAVKISRARQKTAAANFLRCTQTLRRHRRRLRHTRRLENTKNQATLVFERSCARFSHHRHRRCKDQLFGCRPRAKMFSARARCRRRPKAKAKKKESRRLQSRARNKPKARRVEILMPNC